MRLDFITCCALTCCHKRKASELCRGDQADSVVTGPSRGHPTRTSWPVLFSTPWCWQRSGRVSVPAPPGAAGTMLPFQGEAFVGYAAVDRGSLAPAHPCRWPTSTDWLETDVPERPQTQTGPTFGAQSQRIFFASCCQQRGGKPSLISFVSAAANPVT